jgi:uncharacterized protein (TIGR02444 family)
VPDACLSLQNDYGADVNMLLYCCWVGACTGQFDRDLFTRASAFSTLWADHVVVPLRSARTWMKQSGCDTEPVPTDACMQIREEIKSVEFAAEKMQQQVLESMTSIDQSRIDTPEQILEEVIANLNLYAAYVGIDVSDDVRQKFSVIIDAAFPAMRLGKHQEPVRHPNV